MPKVSVVVIAKHKKELDKILSDLKKQDYKDFEVITITGKMKIPKAWNMGIRKAKGEIILFTESDVRVPKNWISEMVRLVKKKGFAMGSEVIVTRRNWNMSCVGIKSEIAKNTLFDESFEVCEDTEWFERLRKKGYEIRRELKPVVYHYRSRDVKKRLIRAFKVGKNFVKIWIKHKNPEMNLRRIILSRGFYITKEVLQLIGVIWGLIRYSYLIPKKFLKNGGDH